jgi:hypothetical protein
VVDVGGGHGGFLIEVLQSSPKPRGVLFDSSHVLAESRISSAGLAQRCEHEVCVSILRNCRNAMAQGGRVLVIDTVIPPGNAPHGGKVLDVMMMASLPGRERTEEEFRKLFAQAGLKLSRVVATPTALSITEAVAA